MVLGDEPQLCRSIIGHHVAGKESEDVVMDEVDCVVDFCLPGPRFVVVRDKFLDGHHFPAVVADKHLTEPSAADALAELDGASDRSLSQQGHAGTASRGARTRTLLLLLSRNGALEVKMDRERSRPRDIVSPFVM